MLEGKHLPPDRGCILDASSKESRAVSAAEFRPLDWGEKAVLLECGS